MYEILNVIFSVFIVVVMAFFAFMSNHMVQEKKERRTIPLPWESKNKNIKEVRCVWKEDTEA